MQNVWNCPLCNSELDHHHFFRRAVSKYIPTPLQITYAICDVCGMVFLWDRHDDKQDDDYYRNGKYRTTVQGTPAITDRVITEQLNRAEYLLPFIDEEPKRVLDIGASTGLWLDVLREKFDCEVLGIEPAEHFRNKSPFKVKMYSELGMLYSPEFYNRFDMITVIHTLEHVTNPVGMLVKLHEFITEDGALYVEVPDLAGEALVAMTISHPIIFTEDTLRTALGLAGWEVEWLEHYHSYKVNRTFPPNILVKARPGKLEDLITPPDIEQVLADFEAGQAQLEADMQR